MQCILELLSLEEQDAIVVFIQEQRNGLWRLVLYKRVNYLKESSKVSFEFYNEEAYS